MGKTKRAIIISASVGAGHAAAAQAYAEGLRAAGWTATTYDFVAVADPIAGAVLRHWYVPQVQRAPKNFTWMINALQLPWSWPSVIVKASAVLASPELLRIIRKTTASTVASGDRSELQGGHQEIKNRDEDSDDEEDDQEDQEEKHHKAVEDNGAGIDLIISTYPLASQALGFLRARGWLDVPVLTHVVDPGLHLLWLHPSVDLHVCAFPPTTATARALGHAAETSTVAARAALLRCFSPEQRAVLRERHGLKPDDVAVVVTAGSLGLGEIEQTVRDILAASQHRPEQLHGARRLVPVVLCGRNDRLRRAVGQHDDVVALGWVEAVEEVYAAADVLVHNAGYMAEEARAATGSRLPLITYRPLPGHGLLNAAAYGAAGISEWPRTVGELAAAIERAVRRTCISRQEEISGQVERGPQKSAEPDQARGYVDLALELAATRDAGRDATTLSSTSIFLLRVASSVAVGVLYLLTFPLWLSVLIWIILPPLTAYPFYLRAVAAALAVCISTSVGLVVALIWMAVNAARRPEGLTVGTKIFTFLVRYTVGMRVALSFDAPIPKGPAVYVLNHQAEIDILVVSQLVAEQLRNGIIIAKKSLSWVPFFGWFLVAIDSGWVDREKRKLRDTKMRQQRSAFIEETIRQVRKGRSILIFPEGTRTRFSVPKLLPFKSGAFVVAAEAGVPIVPVVVKNYSHLYNLRARCWRPGAVEAKVLAPRMLNVEGVDEEQRAKLIQGFADRVREEMLMALKE